MVTPELIAIAVILIFQPLIAFLWAYLIYRATVAFTVGRIESAVDDRIDHINETIRGNE